MGKAGGYILHVAPDRRDVLLKAAQEPDSWGQQRAAEPVDKFSHSKNSPLVVLASFDAGAITHLAEGRKGASAGTGLVRLNISSLFELKRPVSFDQLISQVDGRTRGYVERAIENGGMLTPSAFAEVVRVLEQDRSLSDRLKRYSESRRQRLSRLSEQERTILALQKEALGTALKIADIQTGQLLDWEPPADKPTSFLEGLPEASVREDGMLLVDHSNVPGFKAFDGVSQLAVRTFVSESDPSVRLTVLMANREPLEEQTGADLIYYNEKYRSFVMVQYKAMTTGKKEFEFRWQAGDQFSIELQRMDKMAAELEKIVDDQGADSFRLHNDPFYMKFCPKIAFNPDDRGLFNGMYIPRSLWHRLAVAGALKGPKGGNVLTYTNAGRRFQTSDFVSLVANSWIGTTVPQSQSVEKLIKQVLSSGRAVTYAVKRDDPPEDTGAGGVVDLNGPVVGAREVPEQVMVRVTR
ncbi:hypothetical protein [Rhizobium anhuiense]|uniref:Uncharacterized protein n=1 Tax=Rhizobium anhuiense TaxID=1184720 RepID=A0A3S0QDD7_9HYPH|nr:hypothetical protein [Rhizobium anhuiense]RUM02044.1 hypothetical protein EEQ99_13345 [Rhizobium anhuiense]